MWALICALVLGKRRGFPEEPAVEAISKAAHTGKIGDGKIFLLPVENALRIRTEEQGDSAV